MARILAIDYGKRRTGLAVTDMLQIVPGALDTLDTKQLMSFLNGYVKKEEVERVIIGEPMDESRRRGKRRLQEI